MRLRNSAKRAREDTAESRKFGSGANSPNCRLFAGSASARRFAGRPKSGARGAKTGRTRSCSKKAEENIKKYSSLFPPTEGATGKIGAGFWESYWGYAAAAAALLAIIACIAFRPKKKPEATPFEKASAKLGEAEKIYAASGAKAYAQEVSQAVRDYIEAVHNLPAPERTTEEFLQIAASAPQLDEKERGILENMLKLADIAKFAQHSFRGEEKSKLLSDARDFIFYDNERISQKQKSEKAESSAPENPLKALQILRKAPDKTNRHKRNEF